ncbi:MAG: hypothetical protein GY749_50025 [Desulfobacteraceae bacterium]|nr:hypothetical protein [Desulfobacteraceae bacterium]
MKLNVRGRYVVESITVKTAEKRFDGFFRRTDSKETIPGTTISELAA